MRGFILNGPENNREVIYRRDPDSTNPIIRYDAYKVLWNEGERFKKRRLLAYVASDNGWSGQV